MKPKPGLEGLLGVYERASRGSRGSRDGERLGRWCRGDSVERGGEGVREPVESNRNRETRGWLPIFSG